MKHHFGDMLDRDGGYWTIVPNRERHAYAIGNVAAGSKEITVVTIGRNEDNWERIFTLPNLEELTLHEPGKEQLHAISKLTELKRLRITHASPKDIEFISSLINVEELVFEYVSGFSDLAPLRHLTRLRSLHLENLRGVQHFDGLTGIASLRYLRIDGTLDWKQPISDFEFLKGLPNLEVLSFGLIINNSPYPALLPVLALNKLQTIRVPTNMLAADEYAFMEVALPNVEGASWEPFTRHGYSRIPVPPDDIRARLPDELIRSNHPEVYISYKGGRFIDDPENEWFEFTGKKAGRAKCNSPKSKEKCDEYTKKYQLMKEKARKVISRAR